MTLTSSSNLQGSYTTEDSREITVNTVERKMKFREHEHM